MRDATATTAPASSAIPRPALRILIAATFLVLLTFVGTYLADRDSLLVFFDNAHWTISCFAAAWLAWLGVRLAAADGRAARIWFAIGLTAGAMGQVIWDFQVATDWNPFPAPSDIFFLWLGPCAAIGLIATLRRHTQRSQGRTLVLDASALSAAVLALTLALYLPQRGQTDLWSLTVLVAYPVGLLIAACIGLILVATLRPRWDPGWPLFLGAILANGIIWMRWNSLQLENLVQDGTVLNALFSLITLATGVGAMLWRVEKSTDPRWESLCENALRSLPLLVVMGASAAVVLAWIVRDVPRVAQISAGVGFIVVAVLALARQSIMVRERDRMLRAEEALRTSAARYQALVENQTEFVVRWKPDGRLTFVNEAYLRCFGLRYEETIGSILDLHTAPEDRPAIDAKIDRLVSGSVDSESEVHRSVLPNGELVWQEWADTVIRDESGAVVEIQSVGRDVTARKLAELRIQRLNRTYAVLSDINTTILRERDPQTMFKAACRIAVEKGNFRMAWIGMLDTEANRLEPVASAGAAMCYLDQLNLTLPDGAPAGLGEPIRSGKPAICDDIESEPDFRPCREVALRCGYRSAAAFPLEIEGRAVGVFHFFSQEPRFFDKEEVRLLDELAQNLSFAIEVRRRDVERRKADDELRWRTAFFEAQIESSQDGILVVDQDGKKIVQNQRLNDLWGIPASLADGENDAEMVEFAASRTKNPAQFSEKVAYLYSHPDEISRDEVELVDGTVLDRSSSPVRDKSGRYYGRIWAFRDVTSRKRSEKALLEHQQMIGAIVESSHDWIWTMDLNCVHTYSNQAVEEILGYSQNEFQGLGLDLVHPEDRKLIDAQWPHWVEARQGWRNVTLRWRTKQGSFRYLESTAVPILDSQGELLGYRGVDRDITERKLAEQALQESEAKFRTLTETTPCGIAVYQSHQGRLRFVNSAMRRLTGYTEKELLSIDYWQLVHPDHREWLQARAEARGRGGEVPSRYEFKILSKEGEARWVDFTMGEITFAGEPARVLTIFDITDRRQAESALRASEEQFRQLAENIQEVFWISDLERKKMLYVSPAYQEIWGRTCASLYRSASTWQEAVHPEDRERVAEALRNVPVRGSYDETYRVLRPDGSERWIHDRAFPIRDASGGVLRVVGIAEDTTARQQLEEQFRQAQKMEAIGRLAGGVAHDFNNILTVIQGYSSLLMMSDQVPPPGADAIRQISDASERAASLTRQLLLFSRKQVMQPCQLDLNEIVKNLAKMLQRIIGEDVHLQLNLHARPLPTRADAGMLDQVLMNLAVNARDAMPEGGTLRIETREVCVTEEEAGAVSDASPGPHVCLSVSDTGCGIAPEAIPRIFEPFFTTKGPGKGTGLGLATVFGIVKQHGGWITVRSELNEGTTFQAFLPKAETLAAAKEDHGRTAPRGGLETILLVEDDSAVRAFTRELLVQHGYRVLEACNGMEALEVWSKHSNEIQLLFTDMVMPQNLGGRELAARLRNANPQLRVVFTSGYSADIAGREISLQRGQDFVQKPSSSRQLLDTVRRCLDMN